ncbi:adenosylcobalamin-dependent ribonucleoside-diphosphate reductase [Candidatus Woesearchaeota archaeon]|nr:adenosylcobalamin-dependent ribonucleoside-diphosphate reductase [Candidatus Woesearchaeota archaeon]
MEQKTTTLNPRKIIYPPTEGLKKVQLTENQMKVIKDKYLKDAPTVEAWLFNVARNIALSDLLYEKNIDLKPVFEGVLHEEWKADNYGMKTRTFLLHKDIRTFKERDVNFKKFMAQLTRLPREDKLAKEVVERTAKKFYDLLANFKFLPNSPTLMNAGRDIQQLSGCYVLPVGDSIEEIYESVKDMAIIHKSGGGTGFSFSRLRPANDAVMTTKGISSGPLTFMQIFDKSTEVVKQGGTRRGANMGILRYDHPDIMGFINMKKEPGMMENFNISVAIDDKFMKCVRANKEYDLINPKDGSSVGRLNAKEVWESIIQGAWETGDPGFVIIDRINNSDSNPTPAQGQIESTNPCGEQPLLPYEPCNLGSINLSKYVDKKKKDMDWNTLKEDIFTCMHFLDNVIDVNNYPLEIIEKKAKGNRRVGFGVMGWAETLVMLGLSYNSEEAYEKAEEVMDFVNDNAKLASVKLAEKRGVFPNFKDCIYDEKGKHFRGEFSLVRNSARTTIAPTGTIGITAGVQGAGIEPFFAVVYVRYNAAAVDKLKKGEKPNEKDTFYEINPLFKEIAEQNNYFGLQPKELWDKVERNHKTLIGIPEIPEKIQNLFLTSHDLKPMEHVKMQIAFQNHTNNAVSKTVNLRNEATVDDIREVYENAYDLGAKGVTVYRDGSKQIQILNVTDKDKKKAEEKEVEASAEKKRKKKASRELSAYYEINTGYGPLHIHINYDDEGPTRVFVNISPIGTEISGMTSALSIMISKYLQEGGDPVRLLKHLNAIKGDKPVGFGPKRIDSIPHAISKALRDLLIQTGKLVSYSNGDSEQKTLTPKIEKDDDGPGGAPRLYCPKCYSSNVEIVGGCSGPTCFDCGYSECS